MEQKRSFHLHDGKKGAAIAVRIIPRSSKNEIADIMQDGTVKIRIKAAPVDGKANQMLIDFLSSITKVTKSNIEIVTGQSGKDKLVTFMNISAEVLHQRLEQNLQN